MWLQTLLWLVLLLNTDPRLLDNEKLVDCEVELNKVNVDVGDLIYVRTRFRNISKKPQDVIVPQYCGTYHFTVKHDDLETKLFRGECLALWPPTKKRLEPNEFAEETFLCSPWEVFQYEKLRPRNVSFETLLSNQKQTEHLELGVVWQDFTSSTFHQYESFSLNKDSKFSVSNSRIVLRDRLDKADLFLFENKIGNAFQSKLKFRQFGNTANVDRMAPVTFQYFQAPIHPFYSEPEQFRKLAQIVTPDSTLGHLVKILELCNNWVNSPNGDARTGRADELKTFVNGLPEIERNYLLVRIDELLKSQALERGDFKLK